MAGFATLLGGGLAGLAGANAQGGAIAAQNEVLNNTDKHPGLGGLLTVAGAVIGGILAGGGSVAADVVTGGLNIAATPTEVAAGSAAGGALGNRIGALLNSDNSGDSAASNDTSVADADSSTGPSLPSDLVGEQDSKSGQRGNRNISGPLSPANGGTGDALQDFDKLTGGQSSPAPADSNYPPGTLIGPNGIAYRPGSNGSGARIDIPANGSKPHETLHY